MKRGGEKRPGKDFSKESVTREGATLGGQPNNKLSEYMEGFTGSDGELSGRGRGESVTEWGVGGVRVGTRKSVLS